MACTLDLVARLVEEQTREESMDRIDQSITVTTATGLEFIIRCP